jgi:hypothetical protein
MADDTRPDQTLCPSCNKLIIPEEDDFYRHASSGTLWCRQWHLDCCIAKVQELEEQLTRKALEEPTTSAPACSARPESPCSASPG